MTLPPIRPNRIIDGISAVLLPFAPDGSVDLGAFSQLVERTWSAGLTPAVNMDTGYTNLLTPAERLEILGLVGSLARGRRFVAGAFIEGESGDPGRLYRREAGAIACSGGLSFARSASPADSRAALMRKECGEGVVSSRKGGVLLAICKDLPLLLVFNF